jgi:glycosidase
VDGFRFDAIEVLTETDSARWSNQPGSYSLMKQARELVDTYPHRYVVCEAPGEPDRAAGTNACRSAFAFNLNHTLKQAAQGTGQAPAVAAFPTAHPVGGLATMLSNHDAFAGDRPYTFFKGDEAQARLAAATLLTLPGTPFLYYGEEVGMSNNSSYSGSDWRLRVPMSWTADVATAGFTTGVPFRRLADNAATHNVALEQPNPGSLLNVYKRLLNLRKADPALSLGLYQALAVNDPNGNSLAFLRRYGNQATPGGPQLREPPTAA